jgi:membrane-associated protein
MNTAHVLASAPLLTVGPLDSEQIIQTAGLLGILLIVFAECGLLVGFFLPGDSLLFAAGLLVSTGVFDQPLWLVCLLISLAAIAGNMTGYWIGYQAGPRVFNRPNSKLFRAEYVEKAETFFAKYGARSLILARFVPIVRTFITVMAGAARMDLRRYTLFTVIGGVLWGTGLPVLGYLLGGVEVIANNLEIIALVIVALSVIPMAVELRRARHDAPSD